MEPSSRRQLRDRRFKWDKKFTSRQTKTYRSEDLSVPQKPSQTPVEAFLSDQRQPLDPPQYNCPALKAYLEEATEAELYHTEDDDSSLTSSQQNRAYGIALVDDRSDTTGWTIDDMHHGARDWNGYSEYPPAGENIETAVYNAADLYRKLLASVSSKSIHHAQQLTDSGSQRLRPKPVERRVMYRVRLEVLKIY
jgi:hypothetical protein